MKNLIESRTSAELNGPAIPKSPAFRLLELAARSLAKRRQLIKEGRHAEEQQAGAIANPAADGMVQPENRE